MLVGLGGFEGDLLFPEVVNFVESELRVDDSVFRMTRERAVLLLTDVDVQQARRVVERLLENFRERFPSATEPSVACGYFEVSGDVTHVTAKEVLPQLLALLAEDTARRERGVAAERQVAHSRHAGWDGLTP